MCGTCLQNVIGYIQHCIEPTGLQESNLSNMSLRLIHYESVKRLTAINRLAINHNHPKFGLTFDFCSSQMHKGRTINSNNMYSTTTSGRIHLLQFPQEQGILTLRRLRAF